MRLSALASVFLLASSGCGGGGADCCGPPPEEPPGQLPPGGEPPPATPGVVAFVSVLTGGTQRAEVGKDLPDAIVVRATDIQALAVPQQLINFVVVSGGGSVFAGAAQTNDLGEARERWTLGTIAGEQVLEARAVYQTTGDPIVFAHVTATADPGPAATLSLSATEHQMFLGEQLDLSTLVTGVADQYGNAVEGPAFTANAPPPFKVSGTTVSSEVEFADDVAVFSGAASGSLPLTVIRHLSDLIGAQGTYACIGTPGSREPLPRTDVAFTIDSVTYGDPFVRGEGIRLWVTNTYTQTDAVGVVAVFVQQDGIHVSGQQPGRFYIPFGTGSGDEGWANQTSEAPLTYVGGPYCQSHPNPDTFEPITITK